MALKHKIKKSDYDKLSDELKAEYIAGETDGEYVLDVTGLPEPEDTGPLKRSLERAREDLKKEKAAKAELQSKLDDMPDVEALTTQHKAETGKLSKFVDKTLRDAKALEIATKISTVPALLAPKIAERLGVDMTGDEPKTVILGKDGKPDAEADFDKLSQEFVANPDFKAIIVASKAKGGGAAPGALKSSGGGAPADDDKKVDLASLDGKALAERLKAQKQASAEAQ